MTANILRQAMRCSTALVVALGIGHAQARIEGLGDLASAAPEFNLIAADGHVNAADGVQIYMWGFGVNTGSPSVPAGTMQYVGPTLKVKQGDNVTVRLTNRLPARTSMLFGGQRVSASGGSAGALAREAGPGETVTYTFTAAQAGTYQYQSGTHTALQTEMGLVGALIVYPNAAATCPAGSGATPPTRCAYDHAGAAYERETLLVVSEADSDLHQAVADQLQAYRAANGGAGDACLSAAAGCAFSADLSRRFPKYWFINGRTAPDTLAGNFIGEMPLQPYNTLPRLHPSERMLLRMVGGGTDVHPMHHHGNNSWTIARDGRLLASAAGSGPNLAVSDYTIAVVPGQTTDAIWTWTGQGLGWDLYGATCAAGPVTPTNCPFGRFDAAGVRTAGPACRNPLGALPPTVCTEIFSSSQVRPIANTSPQRYTVGDVYKPIPVKLPSQFELAYGEFYSGSPYLGGLGATPVGSSSLANVSGGYFHMFHSHAEREIVNGGIFPGGMMTFMVIEPAGVAIDTDQP